MEDVPELTEQNGDILLAQGMCCVWKGGMEEGGRKGGREERREGGGREKGGRDKGRRDGGAVSDSWSCVCSVPGTLRPDLIESASSLASGHADVIKTHHNDTKLVRYMREQVG